MKTILESLKEMPEYNCHKIVRAAKITDRMGNQVELEGKVKASMSTGFMNKHSVDIGGYIVLYDNDYLSYSPAKPFEDGYKIKDLMSEIKPQAQERNYAVPYIITPEFDLTKKVESVMDRSDQGSPTFKKIESIINRPEYQDRSHYIAHPSGFEEYDKVFFIANNDDVYYWMFGVILKIRGNELTLECEDIERTYTVSDKNVFFTLNDLFSYCYSNGIKLENKPTCDQYSPNKKELEEIQ